MLGPRAAVASARSTGRRMRRRTTEVLAQLHLDIDPASPLESHSIAVQQLVSIARAIDVDAQVLVLDEPTSSLDAREVDELFEVIAPGARRRASRCCSSPTSSIRCTGSPTASPCCATAAWSASTSPPSCPGSSWCRR